MKFSALKSDLQEAISIVSRAVSTKSSIAVLEGILINAANDLVLCGFDLSTGIKINVEADIIEGGSLVLNAKF